MPRTSITQDNMPSGTGERFPKLKLDTNEVAIYCMFQEPYFEWVHELKAIKIEGGIAVKKVKTRRDNTTYEDYDYDFVGRPRCLGLSATLADRGSDPENCPACKTGNNPAQRYAVNIMRYAVDNTGQPRTPFGADILVWSFTANMFKELFQLSRGVPGKDLTKVDLRMVCEDGHWQRNKVYVDNTEAYCYQEANFGPARALLSASGNLATDDQLSDACGRSRTREQIQMDLDRIAQAAQVASRAGAATPGGLSANLDALLPQGSGSQQGMMQPQAASAPAPAPSQAPVQDPFAPALVPAMASAAPAQAAPVVNNPGVGGWAEFAPVTPAPVPDGQDQAVAAQADNLFGNGQQAAPAQAAPVAEAPAPTGGATPGGATKSFADILNQR